MNGVNNALQTSSFEIITRANVVATNQNLGAILDGAKIYNACRYKASKDSVVMSQTKKSCHPDSQ